MEDEKISDSSNDKLEGTVNMLIEMRKQARDNKNFALSDQRSTNSIRNSAQRR
jgi:cysteinyl-tRNA synthetase